MSVAKSELKMLLLREQGAEIESAIEYQDKQTSGHNKASEVLLDQSKKMLGFIDSLDFDEPSLDLEQRAWVKRQLVRLRLMVVNRAEEQKVAAIASNGALAAYRRMLDWLEKQYAIEQIKKDSILAAANDESALLHDSGDDGRPKARPVGVHPGESIADARKSEDVQSIAPADDAGARDESKKKTRRRRVQRKKEA